MPVALGKAEGGRKRRSMAPESGNGPDADPAPKFSLGSHLGRASRCGVWGGAGPLCGCPVPQVLWQQRAMGGPWSSPCMLLRVPLAGLEPSILLRAPHGAPGPAWSLGTARATAGGRAGGLAAASEEAVCSPSAGGGGEAAEAVFFWNPHLLPVLTPPPPRLGEAGRGGSRCQVGPPLPGLGGRHAPPPAPARLEVTFSAPRLSRPLGRSGRRTGRGRCSLGL